MTFPVLHNTVTRNAEHLRPLFPSVHRLLLEHAVTNLENIKGTGVRGMLTKGDVLTFLGKASNPLGTFKFGLSPIEEASKLAEKKKDVELVWHICSPHCLTCFLNSVPFLPADSADSRWSRHTSTYRQFNASELYQSPQSSPRHVFV